MTSTESGWKSDPTGRFELRFHDGTNWTEHVSTGGVQGTDPYDAAAAPAAGAWSAPAAAPQAGYGAPAAGAPGAGVKFDVEDLKKQPPYFFLIGGGALVLFISSFLSWVKVSSDLGLGFGSVSGTQGGTHYFIGGLLTALFSLILLAYAAMRLMKMEGKVPPAAKQYIQYVAIAAAGLSVLICLYRVLSPSSMVDGYAGGLGVDVSAGFGLYLATLAAIAATVGAVMEYMAHNKKA